MVGHELADVADASTADRDDAVDPATGGAGGSDDLGGHVEWGVLGGEHDAANLEAAGQRPLNLVFDHQGAGADLGLVDHERHDRGAVRGDPDLAQELADQRRYAAEGPGADHDLAQTDGR